MPEYRAADPLLERIPPQNLDAEQAALGAMLLDRAAIVRAAELLQPEDFYRDAHRWIYRGILDLFRASEPVDLITLGEWLRGRAAVGAAAPGDHLLAQVGGTLVSRPHNSSRATRRGESRGTSTWSTPPSR